MSAALALPGMWAAAAPPARWLPEETEQSKAVSLLEPDTTPAPRKMPCELAFYRKHTQKMLRRYLYASMLVGRAPSILGDPVARGWASSRPVRTFEDAVIFVIDVERCLDRLGALDRQILAKVALQDYTQAEAACLLGMSLRTMSYRWPQALDRLTQLLLDAELLVFAT